MFIKSIRFEWQHILLKLFFIFLYHNFIYIEASDTDVCPQCLESSFKKNHTDIVSHQCHPQKKFVHIECFKNYLNHATTNLHTNLKNPYFTPPFYFEIISDTKKIISYQIKCLNCHKIMKIPATQNNIKVLNSLNLHDPRLQDELEDIQLQEALVLENILCSYQDWITEKTCLQTLREKPCWQFLKRLFSCK